jgi:hypothetical protein
MENDRMEIETEYSPEMKQDLRKSDVIGAIDPAHYKQYKIEPIEVIEDWKLQFSLGCAIKYIAGYRYRGNRKKDLIKAANYCYRAATGMWLPQELQNVETTKEQQTSSTRMEVPKTR